MSESKTGLAAGDVVNRDYQRGYSAGYAHAKLENEDSPVPMLLCCPSCGARHVDEGEFAVKAHHTHACQTCGMCWRPAIRPTIGVRFLPGFKNETVR